MLALALSLLGAGGLTAAAVFIPGVLPIVISIAGAILRCKPCLVVIALAVTWVASDIRATRKADAACEAKDIAMQLKAARLQASVQSDAAAFASQQAAALAQQLAASQKEVSDYENKLKTGGSNCRLSPDDVDRLHRLGG